MRPYLLSECTWPAVKELGHSTAVLPWGATEAHNLHLPYATDSIQVGHIAERAAERAWRAGARPVVLPTVPFGVNSGQLSIRLTLNMRPSTQAALLFDLGEALLNQGVRKLLLLNGHGGNDFRGIVRELQADLAPLLIVAVDWYRVLDAHDYFTEPGDHAGELETSVMQALAPDLVRPLAEAGPGSARRIQLAAVREGWAWSPRHWPSATDDTGVGSPAKAAPEKGVAYLDALTVRLADLLVELHHLDPDDAYA